MSVCDAYDALINDRPYRERLSQDQALVILQSGAGRQWDPHIVQLIVDEARRETALVHAGID